MIRWLGRVAWIGLAVATAVSGADTTPLHQQQARTSPEWLTDGIMYQIHLRAFTPEGTLKAAQSRLPKLSELGATVVYVCPMFVSDDDPDTASWSPRQKASKMNNPRNPYRMKDFYHVDPEYGTDQDLKNFVATAHALKLRVMLDMVFLHCGPKAVFLQDHPDFIRRGTDGKPINAAWAFPALNFANPDLREYLWKNMEQWVRDFDVDGFRCDVADGVPLDFWETARDRLENIRPDVGMLAEGLRKTDQLKAFDLDYGWGAAFKEWSNAAAIRKLWETMHKERPQGGAKFIRFIDNHDIANDDWENRVERRWGPANVQAALVAIFTLDGMPFLYNGQEVADTARHSLFGRLPIDWANGETQAGRQRFAFCQRLCDLRLSEKALTKGDVTWLDNDAPEAVLSYLRTFGDQRIVAVVNLKAAPVAVKMQGLAGHFQPLLSRGAEGTPEQGLTLAAHGYFVGKMRVGK